MTLETIQRRQFSDPDRAAVQEAVARTVEKDPDRFIDRYLSMEQSLGGRYVSADLFKQTQERSTVILLTGIPGAGKTSGQALGYAPGSKHQGMDSSTGGRNEDPRHERSGTSENRQENFLAATPTATERNLVSPGTHTDRGEGPSPKPGKDIEESRGRDDDYGL
jgi:hypothetical protein